MEMAKAYLAYRKTVDESKQKTTEKDLEDIYGAYVADLDISRVYLYRDQTCIILHCNREIIITAFFLCRICFCFFLAF